MMYSRYILIPGKDGKNRSREIGTATTNKDGSYTCWDDVTVPVDPSTGRPYPVFMREIVQKEASAQSTASNGAQQELSGV
jgi:hypothetical protein